MFVDYLHCTRSSFSSRIWLFLCECSTFGNGCFSHQLRFTNSSSVVPESHSQLEMSFLSFDRSTDPTRNSPNKFRMGSVHNKRPRENVGQRKAKRRNCNKDPTHTRRILMILTAYLFVGDICRFRLQTSTVAWIPSGTAPLRRRCPKYLCNFSCASPPSTKQSQPHNFGRFSHFTSVFLIFVSDIPSLILLFPTAFHSFHLLFPFPFPSCHYLSPFLSQKSS